jgi:hypothetical protein
MQNRAEKQFQGFLKTPPLWTNSFQQIDQFKLPEIEQPLKQPITQDLPSLSSNFVMGKRVERFFKWIINQNPDYNLLAENMQISRNKITLGELDFLVEDLINRRVCHIEMVYKFYVYDPAFSTEMQRWIGPNRRDTFLQKTEKLIEKQFPLLYKPETEEVLNSLGVKPKEILQQTCFKANLFVPKHLEEKQFPVINNECIAGIWLHFKEFLSAEYHTLQFYAPQKQDWPILPQHSENWVNHSEIITQIENSFQRKKAPLIWVKKPDNKFERIFVVWW